MIIRNYLNRRIIHEGIVHCQVCPLPSSITRKIRPLCTNLAAYPLLPLRSLLLPPAVSYLNATEPKLPSLPTVVGSNIPITAFRQAARQLRGTTFFSLAPQVEGRSIRLWRWDELGKRVVDYDQDVAQKNYLTCLFVFVLLCAGVLCLATCAEH